MKLFKRLKALVLAHGIISHLVILHATDLVEDLDYKPASVAELFRMIERKFRIRITPEEYTEFVWTKLPNIFRPAT